MLNEDRKNYVTASQCYRIMAGFELELAGQKMDKPDVTIEAMEYIEECLKKPKVGDLMEIGVNTTVAEINEVWQYLKAIRPVFSEGMESVAREIAMYGFIEYQRRYGKRE